MTDNGELLSYTTSSTFQAIPMSPQSLNELEAGMLAEINTARSTGGTCYNPTTGRSVYNDATTPLQLESRIYQAARNYADAMVKYDLSSHINTADPVNKTPARRMINAGYKPVPPGEHTGKAVFFEEALAFGYHTPAEVVRAWITESYSHCMSVYAPLTYGGVAVKEGTPNNKYPVYWILNLSGEMDSNHQ